MREAVFARYGSVHRNTYLDAPRSLAPTLELVGRPGLFVVGQMAGVEGYVESAALGFVGGIGAWRRASGAAPALPPAETAHGALLAHLRGGRSGDFQPTNVNYGLFPPLPPLEPGPDGRPAGKRRKREKNEQLARRALAALATWAREIGAPSS